MNVFDYAMQREKDAETFYRELAGKTANVGIRNIMNRLAESEIRHQEVIAKMQEKSTTYFAEDPFLADVKGILQSMRDPGAIDPDEISQVDLYKKAQDFEKKSLELYEEQAEKAETPDLREVFKKLAAQEKRHYMVLDTIVEMVSRPLEGNWLENAEWFHLDEY